MVGDSVARKQKKKIAQESKSQSNTLAGSTQANRQYKASVFSDIMGIKEAALEAYYALKNVRLPEDTPVEILTLSDVMYMGQLNDVAFNVLSRIIKAGKPCIDRTSRLYKNSLVWLHRHPQQI